MSRAGARVGRWRLVRPLGAVSWLAVAVDDPEDRVVLRLLRTHGSVRVRERFAREAEALGALSHPAVVRVREHGVHEPGDVCFLATEVVGGADLADVLARGPLYPDGARRLFRELAAGLAHAHAHGVHHRELGPRRVRVLPDGGCVLVGFGIGREDGVATLGGDGGTAGSVEHLPPEAFDRGVRADPRLADVYALGLLLWEALGGRRALAVDDDLDPDERALRLVAGKLERRRLELPPDVPRDLSDLVERATHPDPRLRLPSMAAFLDRLTPDEVAPVDPTYVESTIFAEPHDVDDLTAELEEADDEADAAEDLAGAVVPAPRGGYETAPSRRPPWVRVVIPLVVAASASAALAAWSTLGEAPPPLPPPPPPPARFAVTVVPSAPSDRVVVDGFQATPTDDGFVVEVEAGSRRVLLAAGACDGEEPACGACCACVEHEIDVRPDATRFVLAGPPPVDRLVRVIVDGAGDAPVRVAVSGVPAEAADDGFLGVAPGDGPVSVRVDAGTCPDDSAGCAASGACPPGCWSTVRSVEVACDAVPAEVRVQVEPPRAAASPRPERRRRPVLVARSEAEPAPVQVLEVRASGDRVGPGSDPVVAAAIARLAAPAEQCWRRLEPPWRPLPPATLVFRLRRDGTVDPGSVVVEHGTGDALLDACLRGRVRELRVGSAVRAGKARASLAFRVREP